jgi:hypothetical protein
MALPFALSLVVFLDPFGASQLASAAPDTAETAPSLPVSAPAPPQAPVEVNEAPPSVGELVGQVGRVISDWRTLGAVAGLIALINLLINLLRLPLVHAYLSERKKRWIKPYLSAGLGALLTGLAAYQVDADLLPAIIAGLIFGLGAVGMHESIAPAYNPRKRVE